MRLSKQENRKAVEVHTRVFVNESSKFKHFCSEPSAGLQRGPASTRNSPALETTISIFTARVCYLSSSTCSISATPIF
jgi:hypothetical protein